MDIQVKHLPGLYIYYHSVELLLFTNVDDEQRCYGLWVIAFTIVFYLLLWLIALMKCFITVEVNCILYGVLSTFVIVDNQM